MKDNHKTLDEVERMQYAKFGQVIADEFSTCKGKEFDIGDMIEPMMKNYKDICKKINDTKIPAIVLTGDPDLLPVLFEKINSKGTQLSKYQIYAATWSGDKFKIDDKFIEIIKANRDRYDVMLEGSGDLTDYDSKSFMFQKELDAFEICFGFGKYLCFKWPHLFGKSQSNSEWKKKYKENFNKNVSKIYIMEVLPRRWIGTGDKKMDLILSNPSYYTREIRKEEFEKVLDNWYEVSNTERMEYLKIATPKESELLIIATVYLPCFSAAQQTDGSNYDIEHLVPQNMIKGQLNRFEGKLKLPISSIGNLCLLPEAANRSKRVRIMMRLRLFMLSNSKCKMDKCKIRMRTFCDAESFSKENVRILILL